MRLYRFYNFYNPANCLNIEKVIVAYHSKQDALFAEITKKYGPEPSHRARFAALFAKYMPDKLSKVDELLAKYQGKEETYIQAIVGKYGPEPILTQADQAAASPPQQAVRNTSIVSPGTSANHPPSSPSQSASGSVADRILRMLQIHLPAKVDQLDTLLEKYKGREEDYLSALVGKYGPEPASSPPPAPQQQQQQQPVAAAAPPPAQPSVAAVPAAATTNTVRDRVGRMLQAYLPNKFPQLDQLLEKYKGREEEYLAALVGKYGPEVAHQTPSNNNTAASSGELDRKGSYAAAVAPPTPLSTAAAPDYKERVTRMFQQYTPAKIGQVDAVLEKYKGREDDYIAALVSKHGPEPAATPASSTISATPALDASVRSEPSTVDRQPNSLSMAPSNDVKSRVARMIQQYLPNKATQIDTLLEKYKGREDEYLSALVAKYGAEPAAPTDAPQQQAVAPAAVERRASVTVIAAPAGAQPSAVPDYKERVTRMFQQYTPAKVGQVEAMLEKYKGREEDYLAALVAKHGPEPPTANTQSSSDSSIHPEGSLTDRKASMASPMSAKSTPPPAALDVKERVARMIRAYLPAKVAQIDAMLEKYKDREEDYLSALVAKYGAEPIDSAPAQQQNNASSLPPAEPQAAASPVAQSRPRSVSDVRSRLQRFYAKYQPDKINNVDGILAKYEGREEDLFTALTQKYGPEPETEPPAAKHQEESNTTNGSTEPSVTPSATAVGPHVTTTVTSPPPSNAQSSATFDWLTTVTDDLERDRLEALAKAHGIATVSDEGVFKLLCSISASLGSMKQALASPAAAAANQTAASPERTALHTRLFADSSSTEAASPSRAALVTESWRDQGRHIAEATRLQILALVEVEQEERRAIEDIDDDERDIICNALNRSQHHTLLKVQLERAVNGNTTSLRRKSFELWKLYAKARQQQRRITQVRDMSMYQRMQMTPLARKYYETIREQDEKKAEKA
ncbi:Hypothetical protein, putative, partial [Bodo saltans]